MGSPLLWMAVPWKLAGMKPALQFRGPLITFPSSSSRTRKAGRDSFSVPRPYVTQLPRLGLPPSVEPEFIWQTPLE